MKYFSNTSLFVLVAGSALLFGCSDSAPKVSVPPGAQQPPEVEQSYGIRVLVTPKNAAENAQWVTVVPADSSHWGQEQAVVENGDLEGQGVEPSERSGGALRAMGIVRRGDQETDTTIQDANKGYATGWSLLYWATRSCYDSTIEPEVDLHIDEAPWFEFGSGKSRPYYNFHRGGSSGITPTSCDVGLFIQETLLCAADRLAQIGDSPGTVTWEVPATANPELSDEEITVSIPPQAAHDVFIARDIAMNALAHIVRLDHDFFVVGTAETCNEAYTVLADSGSSSVATSELFSTNRAFVDGAEPLPNDPATRKAAGRRRLTRKVNVLASTARLIQDLVERSVRDDISGAEQQRTGAADPLVGARAAWGMDEGQAPYNTLRHALRVLYGRIEIGNRLNPSWAAYYANEPDKFVGSGFVWDPMGIQRDDPRCTRDGYGPIEQDGGTAALDVVNELTPGQSARWNDIPPKTRGESLALGLLDRAGIVIPPQALEKADELGKDVSAAIVNQLMLAAAERSGSTFSAYQSGSQAPAFQKVLSEISKEEMRFALARTWDAFRLLTGGAVSGDEFSEWADSTLAVAGVHGMPVDAGAILPGAEDDVYDLGGAVIAGGIPRQDLALDVLSRMRGPQLTSQCGAYPMFNPAFGAHTVLTELGLRSALFQNPFLLSEAVRRQLSHISQLVLEDADAELIDTKRFVDLTAAEVREWAGRGTMLKEYWEPTEEDNLYLANLKPADLGASSLDDLKARLVLVRVALDTAKSATEAECLAGLRESCPLVARDPDDAEAAGIMRRATNAEVYSEPLGTQPEGVLKLSYPHSPAHAHVVLLPKSQSSGSVLGTLRGTEHGDEYFIEVISPRQRQLTNRIFGVGPVESTTRSCTNIAPLSMSTDYCIEGMKRDQFVPLANELTSAGTGNEDSWRHYLSLAEQAAAKTDELGREMIDVGLQDDIRKEAAAEAVGELCGAFGTVDNTKVENGQLSLSQDDAQLNACIGGPKTDIVFLRDDPFALDESNPKLKDEPTISATLRQTYCDNPAVASKPPFCAKDPGELISHAGLGYQSGTTAPVTGSVMDACASVRQALTPRELGSDPEPTLTQGAFGQAVAENYATVGGMGATVSALKLEIERDGKWVLMLGSRPLMGSDALVQPLLGPSGVPADDVWPLCTRTEGVTCSGIAEMMMSLFPNPLPTDTVYPEIRTEVERTLFYMGAMAGAISEGQVRMPIPAVNRKTQSAGSSDWVVNNASPAPAPAIYGAGHFKESAGVYALFDEGYLGHLPWTEGEASMVGPLRPFDRDYATLREIRTSGWREELYRRIRTAPVGAYLAIDAWNGPINFDEGLVPGSLGREFLPDWLSGLGQAYSQGDDIHLELEKAGYYTPGRFCRGGGFSTGRDVCVDANVSPVFHTVGLNQDACGENDIVDSTAPTATMGLLATTTIANVSDLEALRWFAVYTVSGETSESCADEDCTHPAGSRFKWAMQPDDCGAEESAAYWDIGTNGQCEHWPWQLSRDEGSYYWPVGKTRRLSHERLMPSQCSPAERVEMFMEQGLAGRVQAMETIIRALGVACTHSALHLETKLDTAPPAIRTTEDIRTLEGWMNHAGFAIDSIANYYYLVDVPEEVVALAQTGTPNVGAVTAGQRGELLLDLEQKLRLIENGFASAGATLQMISDEIEKTRLELEAVHITNQQQQLQIAAAKIDNDRNRAKAEVARVASTLRAADAAAGIIASIVATTASSGQNQQVLGGGSVAALINAGQELASAQIDLGASDLLDKNLGEQAKLADDAVDNNEALAIVGLSEAVVGLFQSMRDSITGIQNNVSSTLQTIAALNQNESKARIALAKAGGADFVRLQGQDALVPLHVNTVYRRQFNILKLRYERALESAKRAAYLARLSIEERLGIRLDDLHQSIGPLEPPAVWVNDLCTVQGIDYKALRTAIDPESGGDAGVEDAEADLIQGFADQYIGDYVAKLSEFVEFYNLEFPFRESNDVAVVSLREDLPNSLAGCTAESKNLLYFSDQLNAMSPDLAGDAVLANAGWNRTGCDSGACIELLDGAALFNDQDEALEPPATPGGATWLRTVARVPADEAVWQLELPAASVFQTVKLRAGTRYVLSWYDMARNGTGGPVASTDDGEPYQVGVYDSTYKFVAGEGFEPAAPTNGVDWSERRVVEVIAFDDADYHVVFSPGKVDDPGASLAIANVQFEEAPGNVSGATTYESTNSSRTRLTGNCPADTPEQFRKRFEHRCDRLGCWFELGDILAIDTELLNQGGTSLVGQVAAGNFNYRNGGVALNVVGTGVLDCASTGSASCYGSAYVEYDLQHVAYSVPLEDYESNVRCFDFGAGNIRGGKALAAERFITLPMSSADKEMVNSAPFLKPEFTGRPLSGSYRLRIKDSPALAWEQVDDVQIILNYNYWSRVERSPGN